MKIHFSKFVFASFIAALFFGSCQEQTSVQESDQKEDIPNEFVAQRSYLDSLIQSEPRNPEYYYQRAQFNYSNNILPAALADIYSSISIDSANAKYYYLAGDLFMDMNEGNKAVQLMSKGISLMPNNEELYLRATEYNMIMLNHEAAFNFVNDLLAKNKFNAEAYFLKGLIFKELGEEEKAISNFQTCTEQDPTFYNAYMQLGVMLSKKEDALCVKYFDNALKINPMSREAIYGKAYFYQQSKEYQNAITTYRELIKANSKDHEAFYNIGFCYLESDSLVKAYGNFNIAGNLKPTYTDAYYMKGYVSELAKNYDDALIQYNQANLLLPENEEIIAAIDRVKAKI